MSSKKRKYWTAKEDTYLLAHWGQGTKAEKMAVAEYLGRTVSAVDNRKAALSQKYNPYFDGTRVSCHMREAIPPECVPKMLVFLATLRIFADVAKRAGVKPDITEFINTYRRIVNK